MATPKQVTNKMAKMTTAELIDAFAETENVEDEEIYEVRGWFIEGLEARDTTAFDSWIEGDATPETARELFLH